MRGAGVIAVAVAVACALFAFPAAAAQERIVVGSKAFPESWILGEAMAALARAAQVEANHRANLGGTEIVAEAARTGAIDAYPEYTGTLREVVLHSRSATIGELRARLARDGLGVTDSLGFDDSYALAVSSAVAARDAIASLSDAAGHPELRAAFTHEFLGRGDGWPGLRSAYGLRFAEVRGVAHELAFEALAAGQADVVDVYTTDPQIARLGLRVLADDRGFFPTYEAVVVYRLDLETRAPNAIAAIRRLVGTIDRATMARANAAVADHVAVDAAARDLLRSALGGEVPTEGAEEESTARDVMRHVLLVAVSLAGSIAVGLPLGILAARRRRAAAAALATAGIVQTIPSLALLALLIPFFGIGVRPAIAALFLYGLLPIVQGAYTGLTTIPAHLAEAAEALGLSPTTKLLRIELPLALPAILAGVRTSAVIGVGTATIAALVGAGGLGDPILRGITLRSTPLILSGAVPAALLAVVVQGVFSVLEKCVVSKGLTLRTHVE